MAERNESHLLEALPDGVVVADGEGLVTHVNDAARRVLGNGCEPGRPLASVMSLQDLNGHDWYAVVAPYDGLPIRRTLLESAWQTSTGTEVLVTGTLHRERPAGPVDRVTLCLRSGRSRERVERGRSDMVATVAHELRSPLTGVKGFTATLLAKWDKLTDSQRLLMLSTVDADADRLRRLIEELLDAARIDSGRLTVRKEPVDVAAAVDQQVAALSTSRDRELSVEVRGHPVVWVDKDKLAQIVGNLVENALRHGDGNVSVTVGESIDSGVEVVVEDNGSGIPHRIRSRIFNKFWRHGDQGGSGLGLYVVAGLVAAHEGEITVEDADGGGARMRVRLPEGKPAVLDDETASGP